MNVTVRRVFMGTSSNIARMDSFSGDLKVKDRKERSPSSHPVLLKAKIHIHVHAHKPHKNKDRDRDTDKGSQTEKDKRRDREIKTHRERIKNGAECIQTLYN